MTDERVRALKEQLEHVRRERDAERASREEALIEIRKASEKAAQERHEEMMAQMRALSSALRDQKHEHAEHSEKVKRALDEEATRRQDKDARLSEIEEGLTSVRDGLKTEISKKQERGGDKTGIDRILEEIRKSGAEKTEMLLSLSDQIQADSRRRHEELRSILLANASARESMAFSDDI
ncbi:hypothetical protein FA95DRAFT_1602312 [Auriscalpium vulgare]|uniref:Uncharacterized protein n=1 Tax=Auriscalpium vulgare TaxID=40419 RepID=A0ACB8S6S0_9AGAM|nr:hypothetical protein FA95DRAFT_1602312 [Auriscalpium vulgare]